MNAHAQWLEDRRKGIGGSDVAAVLGLSKWKTPYQVWQDKLGLIPATPDNDSMKWGRLLEPVVRQQYAEATGREVKVPTGILQHQDHKFMLANLDGFTDDGRIVEIKTARRQDGWGDAGTDEVPQEYLLQVQHYMAVTKFEVADIAVLIAGSDFRLYHVHADRELQEMMIEQEAEFWRLVESHTPPDALSFADAVARYGRSSKTGEITATEEVLKAVEELASIRVDMKLYEAREEELKGIVMAAMGDFDTLTYQGKTLVTWKAAKPTERFDSKAFKAAHPELAAQFTVTGEGSRRFLIK